MIITTTPAERTHFGTANSAIRWLSFAVALTRPDRAAELPGFRPSYSKEMAANTPAYLLNKVVPVLSANLLNTT